MELRQLKYFTTVAETLNFSEAASRLFITQGTLSQQIRQLEDELGSQLFERSSHSVRLTEAGEELLPLALQTLESARSCRSRMNDLRGALSGTLNIGVTHSFSGLLTETVRKFLKEYPGVKLNIHYKTASELIDMLREKQIDMALAFKPNKEYDEIVHEVVFTTKLSVVMRKDHPLADRKSIAGEELERYGLVIPGSGLQARKAFERYVGIDTRRLDVRMEVNDPNLIMDIVQAGNLITIVSSLAAVYRPNLVAVPFENGRYSMFGCINYLKDGYRKRSADVFIEMLRDSALIERIVNGE